MHKLKGGGGVSNKGLVITAAIVIVAMFVGMQITGNLFQVTPAVTTKTCPDGTVIAATATCPGVAPTVVTTCESGTTPSMTFTYIDKYNTGTALTSAGTALMTREVGKATWTSRTPGTSFEVDVGEVLEVAAGVNTTDGLVNTSSGTIGQISFQYTVPCKENPDEEIMVARFAEPNTVTVVVFDPEDGNSISASDAVDIDVSDSAMVLDIHLTGEFEKNWGSEDCGAMSNVFVVRYNTTQYDKILMNYAGTGLSTACSKPTVLSSSSGYTDKAFCGPVVKSATNLGLNGLQMVIDADDTVDPNGHSSNITLYYYDSAKYYDEDLNELFCGVEDEDYTDIGAAGPISKTIVVYNEGLV